MPDAHKSRRQHMSCKPAKELHPSQSELFFLCCVSIVLVEERDCFIIDIRKSVIGDGDFMGISTQIFDDRFWRGKGAFGIDDPFCLKGFFSDMLRDINFLSQRSHELSPEDCAQCPFGEQILFFVRAVLPFV